MSPNYIRRPPRLMQGVVLYEWNRIDEAEGLITSNIALVEECTIAEALVLGYITPARISMAQGRGTMRNRVTQKYARSATEFDPEKLVVVEIGVKCQFLKDTLQINGAVFHYKYDDVQVNVDDPVSPLVPITRNIGEQKNIGVEAVVVWQPSANWFLKQGAGYLDAEYDNIDRVISTYAGPIALVGKRAVNSPKWTYKGILRFQTPASAGRDIIVLTDYRWVDDRILQAGYFW